MNHLVENSYSLDGIRIGQLTINMVLVRVWVKTLLTLFWASLKSSALIEIQVLKPAAGFNKKM